jgi:phytoene desaturase
LFFDEDMDEHSRDIYQQPQWPKKPLFYVCCPSKTDDTVAPKGMENLFILMPIAPDLEDTEMLRNTYFDIIMQRMEHLCKDTIKQHIVYHRSYCIKTQFEINLRCSTLFWC